MKASRFRRIDIVLIALIIVVGAGTYLIESRTSANRNSWWGTWSGTIAQPDSSMRTWTFSMSLHETNGKFIGSYVESSLQCGGRLSKTFANSSELRLDETVTLQPPSGTPWFCGGGPIQIKRTGTNTASYNWDDGVAHGVIRR